MNATPGTYVASTSTYWLDTVERLVMAIGDLACSEVIPVVDIEIR